MFNAVHQGRKYVPTRPPPSHGSMLTVQPLHISRTPVTLRDEPEATWPPPGAKMRVSKDGKGGVVVKAVRRHTSPQPPSLESLEAAWGDRGHASNQHGKAEAARDGPEAQGGGPPRARKKSFRPPDVRTIFSPGQKDPRVKQESGEGHAFGPGGEGTWCDVCCKYMFQHGLTCTGEWGWDGTRGGRPSARLRKKF